MFANQGEADVCVYNGADPLLAGVQLGGRGRKVDFSPRVGEHEFSLPGPHNAENAAAAAVAAEAMGIGEEPIARALASFRGVPHRLERVAELDGVLYVNDSKATNVAAAVAALRSFDGGVRAILGGSLKGGGFAELAPAVAERCVACYLIGEAAERLERDLEPAWAAGVEHRRCDGLAEAVARRGRGRRGRRGRPAGARVRELRQLPRLRGARRALPRAGRGASMKKSGKASPPIEYSLLLTATLCLLAFGVVMVFSASSTTSLLGNSGDGAYYLKRTVLFGAVGLVVMRVLSISGLAVVRRMTPLILGIALIACVAVLMPGIGVEVNGATPLDRRRASSDPALGGAQGRAGPLRRRAARRAAEDGRAGCGRWSRTRRGRDRLPARRRRARPRHRDGRRASRSRRC